MFTSGRKHETWYFGVLDHADSKFNGNHASRIWLPIQNLSLKGCSGHVFCFALFAWLSCWLSCCISLPAYLFYVKNNIMVITESEDLLLCIVLHKNHNCVHLRLALWHLICIIQGSVSCNCISQVLYTL